MSSQRVGAVIRVLALMTVALAACSPPPAGTIAVVDGELIPHTAIRCDADMRIDEGRCLRQEQGRLQSLLHRRVIRRAAQDQGIRISEAELRSAIPQIGADDLRTGVALSRALARAVVSVKDGEPIEAVYDRELSSLGYPSESFEHAVRVWTREDAMRQLTEDPVRTMESETLETTSGRLEWQALSRLAGERASKDGTTREEEMAAILDAAHQKLKIRIVDSRYEIANAKAAMR
jgi:hypothetical protein